MENIEVLKPLEVCEANRAEIDARCKRIKGRFYVVKGYDHLTDVITTIEQQLEQLTLSAEDYVITYTSGDDISERDGYERWATEVDLSFEQGRWYILDMGSTKIPYEPINYRLIPKVDSRIQARLLTR